MGDLGRLGVSGWSWSSWSQWQQHRRPHQPCWPRRCRSQLCEFFEFEFECELCRGLATSPCIAPGICTEKDLCRSWCPAIAARPCWEEGKAFAGLGFQCLSRKASCFTSLSLATSTSCLCTLCNCSSSSGGSNISNHNPTAPTAYERRQRERREKSVKIIGGLQLQRFRGRAAAVAIVAWHSTALYCSVGSWCFNGVSRTFMILYGFCHVYALIIFVVTILSIFVFFVTRRQTILLQYLRLQHWQLHSEFPSGP